MNGWVDDDLRALLRVPVSSRGGERTDLGVWIGTAFNGGLAIPRQEGAKLGLVQQSSAEAILADGGAFELETFACVIDWFGNCYETQIAAGERQYPVLGTMLLEGRLGIDYGAKNGRTHVGTGTNPIRRE